MPTAPTTPGRPCEWCWNAPASEAVETTPAKVVTRGERKGDVDAPAVRILACKSCAAKLEAIKERKRQEEDRIREERAKARRAANAKAA